MIEKLEIKDFDMWLPYDGIAEGSGRSEKIWLQSAEGHIGLFKFPKIDPATNKTTHEHISEHLASKLAEVLDVKAAKVDIGTYNNRIGCMSYQINKSDEALVEGLHFIIGKHPNYNIDTMIDEDTGRHYCVDNLLELSDKEQVIDKWIQMMLFDYLIGNSDRHQSNWAVLVKYADSSKANLIGKVCPLYDNGSSLCCYENDKRIHELLGKDIERFEALVDTKSRSMIRIDGYTKKNPTHIEVVQFLLQTYDSAIDIAKDFIKRLNVDIICALLDVYPEFLLGLERRNVIERFLCRKLEILQGLLEEVK